MPRSIVYVDGLNLYYGAVKGSPYKWLNLQRFFELLRPHDDLHLIHYFTAEIAGPTRHNQEVFLQALSTLPLLNVVLGKFKLKRVLCTNSGCTYSGPRTFQIPEEKRTDVNIAVFMLDDAYQNRCDNLILVSGDSDLVPAVRMVKTRFPSKKVIVYVPTRHPIRGAAVELRSAADISRDLPLNLLKFAQFPTEVHGGAGAVFRKPAAW